MGKPLRLIFLFAAICTLLVNCRKKQWDEYYNRPDSLEQPIYQQLEARGNFKSLLACIDKAGYKNTLGAAGYWTFFAPTDSAFDVYFKQNNISGVDQLDSNACRKIVTYCLVYNAFKLERLGDAQTSTGWIPNTAFKRRTANYTGVYDGKDSAGRPIKIISSNRNGGYVDGDNNNKYIPYFVNNYMSAKLLTATDYNYFYPNTPFTGFNVVDAIVTEKDIPAENGVIHIVNKVISALPSLDEYLAGHDEYSEFRKLFDKYLITYAINPTATQNYSNLHGGATSIYTKIYYYGLGFSPNNENFLKLQDNDGQSGTYTMFIPTNTALLNYINTVLLEHYSKVDDLPRNIIYDFVNAHMWQTPVWPTKFKSTYNVQGEEARFDPSADVIDKKILSNAIFYGTNKVQEANVFSSVYGKAYLDPQYSMMTSLLNQELKYQISNISQKYTVFLVSNSVLNKAGYKSDPTVDNNPNYQWRYTPLNGTSDITGSSALVRLLRIINLHVIPTVDVQNLSGSGVLMSYGGEFVRYNNNTVFASGNVDSNNVANSTLSKTAKNGTVFYLDRMLNFSESTIGKHIEKLGTMTNSQYSYFWNYLKNWVNYTPATGDIVGVSSGVFYTVFIPNNNAILAAVNAGLLPGTGPAGNKVPNYTPSAGTDKDLISNFIYYHILNKKSVATNGMDGGSLETLYKTSNGDATSITVHNDVPNVMTLTDAIGRTANIILSGSNYLSNRCVIHLIDNYLQYPQ